MVASVKFGEINKNILQVSDEKTVGFVDQKSRINIWNFKTGIVKESY